MAKTHKLYKIYFTVQGSANFPIDMLRFDRCAPREEIDSHNIENEGSFESMSLFAKRQVKLVMFSYTKDGPTIDRWKSFGWEVLSQEVIKSNA